MMLNAQKTISLFFKTADFERAFGRFLANHSRVIKALKHSREKRIPNNYKRCVYLKLYAGYGFEHLFIIKKAATGEAKNPRNHAGNADPL